MKQREKVKEGVELVANRHTTKDVAKDEQTNKMFFVYGRFRPLNKRERMEVRDCGGGGGDGDDDEQDDDDVVRRNHETTDNETILVDRKCGDETVTVTDHGGSANKTHGINSTKSTLYEFRLDKMFYRQADQASVYEQGLREHVRRFVDKADDANLLTYGQTSSGKTWTIDGNFYARDDNGRTTIDGTLADRNELGLMPRILAELCKRYAGDVLVNYYEIYCEKVYDLLARELTNETTTASRKQMRESRFTESNGRITIDVQTFVAKDNRPTGQQRPDELAEHSFASVCRLLRASNKNRHFNATAMNETSSRSHTFLEILCPTGDTRSRTGGRKTFRIVDLAGSERVNKTQAREQTLIEGININNSLMYLKQMIEIVAANSQRRGNGHVPKFRETKLTRILHSSINEGRSRMILILCCSPSLFNYNETVNTLRFGCTAKRIEREIRDSSTEFELSSLREGSGLVGLHGARLDEHEERLRTTERRAAAERLRQLETELIQAQETERKGFQRRVDEYEEQIERLQNTMQAQTLSIETLAECRRTIALQRSIIDEMTREKQRLRKELQVYQMFREYMISTCSTDTDEADDTDDDEHQRKRITDLLNALEN